MPDDWLTAYQRLLSGRTSPTFGDRLYAERGPFWSAPPVERPVLSGEVQAVPFGAPGDVVTQLILVLAPLLRSAGFSQRSPAAASGGVSVPVGAGTPSVMQPPSYSVWPPASSDPVQAYLLRRIQESGLQPANPLQPGLAYGQRDQLPELEQLLRLYLRQYRSN
jgi:hypothetical protein